MSTLWCMMYDPDPQCHRGACVLGNFASECTVCVSNDVYAATCVCVCLMSFCCVSRFPCPLLDFFAVIILCYGLLSTALQILVCYCRRIWGRCPSPKLSTLHIS